MINPQRFTSTTDQLQFNGQKGVTYLEDLREEAWTDLLTEEVIDAGQAGHGAPQGPVWGRADPVGRVDAVEGRLI